MSPNTRTNEIPPCGTIPDMKPLPKGGSPQVEPQSRGLPRDADASLAMTGYLMGRLIYVGSCLVGIIPSNSHVFVCSPTAIPDGRRDDPRHETTIPPAHFFFSLNLFTF